MIKYKTRWEEIKKIEISRESDSSVWDMQNRRHNKNGEWENYFDTFEEAKNYLIEEKNKEIKKAQEQLEYVMEKLKNVSNIKEEK